MTNEVDPNNPEWSDVDVVVLSCWPKNLMPVMPYVGSIDGTCEICSGDVWIGGRQQTVIAEFEAIGKQVSVVCVPCTARLQAHRAGRFHDDVHATIALGGEATLAGSAQLDQLAKELGMELP